MAVVLLDTASKGPNAVLSAGNLRVSTTINGYTGARSDLVRTSGKWWFEVDTTGMGSFDPGTGCGVVGAASPNYTTLATTYSSPNGAIIYRAGGIGVNGVNVGSAQNIQAAGHVMVAVDLDTNRIWFQAFGVAPFGWNGSLANDPDAGTGGFDISAITTALPGVYAVGLIWPTTNSLTFNFGATPPVVTPPATFCPWDDVSCTPAIADLHFKQGPYYRLAPPIQVFTLTSHVPLNVYLAATEAGDICSATVAPTNAGDMAATEAVDSCAGTAASVTLPHGLINGEIIYIPQEDNGVRIEPEPFNQPFTIPYEDTVVIIPYEDR